MRTRMEAGRMACGEIWGMAVYFNPCGWQTKRLNYDRFRASFPLPLLTIEVSASDAFELTPSDAERLVQLTGESFIWQKEAAINAAVGSLPHSCTAVLWTDADLVWQSESWTNELRSGLRRNVVVQAFSEFVRLPAGFMLRDAPAQGQGELAQIELQPGFAAWHHRHAPSGTIRSQRGHVGFAWAAPKKLLEDVGLYPYCVLGGGDAVVAYASLGGSPRGRLISAGGYRRSMDSWRDRWYRAVNKRIGFVAGVVHHHWHGNEEHRQYKERHALLCSLNFDPLTDVAFDANGLLMWQRPELKEYARRYFSGRMEDGAISANCAADTQMPKQFPSR
jgi:hypothetical protein